MYSPRMPAVCEHRQPSPNSELLQPLPDTAVVARLPHHPDRHEYESSLSCAFFSPERQRSAWDLFKQHGITGPTGWLPEETAASLGVDGNASLERYCRICHVCFSRTWSPHRCGSCGHQLCQYCTYEVPGGREGAHEAFSHHPSSTIRLERENRTHHAQSAVSTPELHRIAQQTRHEQLNRASENMCHEDKTYTNSRYHRNDNVMESQHVSNKEHSHASKPGPSTGHHSAGGSRHEQVYPHHPTWSLKGNSFLVADNQARMLGCHDSGQFSRRGECHDQALGSYGRQTPIRHSSRCASDRIGRERSCERLAKQSRLMAVSRSPPDFDAIPLRRPENGNEQQHGEVKQVHRHHSAGFHNTHHIAEHLAKAVGNEAFENIEKRIRDAGAQALEAAAKVGLKPLTAVHPVAEVSDYKYKQDIVPPGHPTYDEDAISVESSARTSRHGPNGRDLRVQQVSENRHGRGLQNHHYTDYVTKPRYHKVEEEPREQLISVHGQVYDRATCTQRQSSA
ncbi:hypothetical protein F5Y15DRAFT_337828 [Xylariaceae sp. FL0016]|nr:hypothetical protein F5Y15DRAFT_337828 [Xylariaceae sp. FL0016]